MPEGVLFGSTGAHKELRRQLIENNRVEAVLSLPGGVFQPYTGVKTSILIFRKETRRDHLIALRRIYGYKMFSGRYARDLGGRNGVPVRDDRTRHVVSAS
mgnify:CR=1 FL=1